MRIQPLEGSFKCSKRLLLSTLLTSLFILLISSALLRAIVNTLVPFESVKRAFFFPGVLIHEGAHAGISKLLGVPIREINFQKGYVALDSDDLGVLKRFLIGISPLLVCWVVGGALFLIVILLLAAGHFALGIILVLVGLSIFAQAAPSSQDIATFLQGEAELVTVAVWVLVCGLLGFITILEQPFGALEPFKQTHLEEFAIGGAVLTAGMGYLVYRVATRSEREDKGKEWIW